MSDFHNDFHESLGLPERYSIESLAGRGGFGVVYKAHDAELNTAVAIKVADMHHMNNPKFSARWHREISLNARLRHPRIVPVFDIGETRHGQPYVTMGFAGNGDLASYLKQGPSRLSVLTLLIDALDGLAALHSWRIIHQDIKPDNILIDSDGRALIADLGVSATKAELVVNPKGIAGTPEFMSPEQQQRLPQEMGPWSDLYAVGRILDLLDHDIGPLQPLLDVLLTADPLMRIDSAADLRCQIQELCQTAPEEWLHCTVEHLHVTIPKSRQEQQFQSALPDTQIPWRQFDVPDFPESYPHGTEQRQRILLPLYQDPPLIGRTQILDDLWQYAHRTCLTQKAHVVLLVGPKGVGKTRIMANVARRLERKGLMSRLLLRYHQVPSEDDGYHGAIRELLSPIESDAESFKNRIQRYLSRMYGIPIRDTADEAAAITRWCGFESGGTVNSATGLLLLYQWLRCYAWRGGVCLTLDHPQRSVVAGDGLDICEALLSESVGCIPAFVMATVSTEDIVRNPALQQRIDLLCAQGAHCIHVPCLKDADVIHLAEEAYGLSVDNWRPVTLFCAGMPSRLVLLFRLWEHQKSLALEDNQQVLKIPIDQAVPNSDSELAEQMLTVLLQKISQENLRKLWVSAALARSSISFLLLRCIDSSAVDSLMSMGVLRQRERRLTIEPGILIEPLMAWGHDKLDLASLHATLADAWSTLRVTRYYSDQSIGFHLLSAGQSERALPHLLRASRQALNDGRFALSIMASKQAYKAAQNFKSHMASTEALLIHLQSRIASRNDRGIDVLFEQLEELCAKDTLSRGRLMWLKAWHSFEQNQFALSLEQLQMASQDLQRIGDAQHMAQVHRLQGQIFHHLGEFTGAADRLARNVNATNIDTVVRQQSLYTLTSARVLLGWHDGLDDQIGRLLKEARSHGNVEAVAWCIMAQGLAHLVSRKYTIALRRFQAAYAAAAACGQRSLRGESLLLQGLALVLDNRVREAHACYQILAQSSEGHGLIDRQVMASVLAQCCLCHLSEHQHLGAEIDRLAALQVAASDQASSWIHLLKVWFHHHHDRTDQAKKSMEQALNLGLSSDWNLGLAFVLATLMQQNSIHKPMLEQAYGRFEQFLPHACFLSSEAVA